MDVIRYTLLFVLLAGFAFAQTSLPASVQPAQSTGNASVDLPPGVSRPEPIGNHICSGFPELAAHSMVDGTTIVVFTIAADGKVSNASIGTSSGDTHLDSASLLCVEGWLYTPATRNGQAVPFRAKANFVWKNTTASDEPASGTPEGQRMVTVPVWASGGQQCEQWHAIGSSKPERPVILAFFVEPDGSVKDISVVQSSGHDNIDKDAIECLGGRHYQPAKQDGKPIEVHISDWLY